MTRKQKQPCPYCNRLFVDLNRHNRKLKIKTEISEQDDTVIEFRSAAILHTDVNGLQKLTALKKLTLHDN